MAARERAGSTRRQSVAPTSSYQWRNKQSIADANSSSKPDEKTFPSALRTASLATNRLIKVSKMFSMDKTRDVIRVALQDPDRLHYVKVACMHEELVKVWKQLKGFIQELSEKYEAARSFDPVRRYKKLQSMTKTLVLNLRLTDPESIESGSADASAAGGVLRGDVLQSSVKQREMHLKYEKMGKSFTSDELAKETEKLTRQNAELQARIDELIEAINELDEKYRCSKSEPFIKRYTLLKDALKEVGKFADVDDYL